MGTIEEALLLFVFYNVNVGGFKLINIQTNNCVHFFTGIVTETFTYFVTKGKKDCIYFILLFTFYKLEQIKSYQCNECVINAITLHIMHNINYL